MNLSEMLCHHNFYFVYNVIFLYFTGSVHEDAHCMLLYDINVLCTESFDGSCTPLAMLLTVHPSL